MEARSDTDVQIVQVARVVQPTDDRTLQFVGRATGTYVHCISVLEASRPYVALHHAA